MNFNKNVKKIITITLALVLMSSLSATAFAAEYDVSEGDVTIPGFDSEARVYRSKDEVSNNNINIQPGSNNATVTFDNVETTGSVSINSSNDLVTLNFVGENKVGTIYHLYDNNAPDKETGLKLVGEEGSSLEASQIYVNAHTETTGTVSTTIENLDLACTDITLTTTISSTISGDVNVTLSIQDSTIETKYINTQVIGSGCATDGATLSVDIENSDITIKDGLYDWGIAALNFNGDEADESLINIENSNIDIDVSINGKNGIAMLAVTSNEDATADIQLTESKFVSPDNISIDSIPKEVFPIPGVCTVVGDKVANKCTIVRDSSPSPSASKDNQLRRLIVIENEDGTFTIKDAKLEDFIKMLMDNKLVKNDTENFVLTTGENETDLHLAFSESFLKDLTSGEHPVYMLFNGAYAQFNLSK